MTRSHSPTRIIGEWLSMANCVSVNLTHFNAILLVGVRMHTSCTYDWNARKWESFDTWDLWDTRITEWNIDTTQIKAILSCLQIVVKALAAVQLPFSSKIRSCGGRHEPDQVVKRFQSDQRQPIISLTQFTGDEGMSCRFSFLFLSSWCA